MSFLINNFACNLWGLVVGVFRAAAFFYSVLDFYKHQVDSSHLVILYKEIILMT